MRFPGALLVVGAAATAGAQQKQPPIRQLGPVLATSDAPVGGVFAVRALPGARVLVNDASGRRVILLDSTLAVGAARVVADSTSATANAYGGSMAGLIPYRGDSTLFVDPQSMSMMVIDPNGTLGRVMSVPRSQDAFALVGPLGATAGFDAAGHLVYRTFPRLTMTRREGTPGAAQSGMPPMPQMPDSLPIVRVDLATRAVDTVARLRIPRPNMQMTQDDKGNINVTAEINPLPIVDDWAVTSTGAIALVRGQDYHVDWIRPDGSVASTPKIPFDWQRLTDEDKVAFIDSVKAARQRMIASMPAPPSGAAGTTSTTNGGRGGAERRTQVTVFAGEAAGGTGARGTMGTPRLNFIAPSELPDYKPPFFANAVRADMEGRIWIRTIPTRAIPGGPVYDVVNDRGELVERVQVPAAMSIVGFGPGTVYLIEGTGANAHLVRARMQ